MSISGRHPASYYTTIYRLVLPQMLTGKGEESGPQFVNLADLEQMARDKLGLMSYDFIAGGAGAENTIKANREGFDRIALVPRFLTGIQDVEVSTIVLGQTLEMPIYVTPMANQGVAHPTAEVGTAMGASKAHALFVTPTGSTKSLEDVAKASGDSPRWFQFYFNKERKVNEDLLGRAEKAGCSAVLMTVDLPVLGLRERNVRNQFALPTGQSRPNLESAESPPAFRDLGSLVAGVKADLSWDDFEWTREHTPLPVLIKGIVSPEDAEEAVRRKAAGIVVSNHGGRQLDTGLGAIEALPPIVERVKGRTKILFDSGVRRGIDVFKALALGASAVGVGRPILYGLAVYGAEGVTAVLEHLRAELVNTMRLCGVNRVNGITRDFVRTNPNS